MAGTYKTVLTFSGTNGADPNGLTIDSAGDIFGTTQTGGANGYGTVFEIPAGTTTEKIVYSFTSSNDTPGVR